MRLCIFADIHGNAPAFRAAYKSILTEAADVNLFVGDLCGYYYDQVEVYEMLKTVPNLAALKGNHDKIFLDIVRGNDDLRRSYREQYGNSMENLLRSSTHEFINWLDHLPEALILDDIDTACYHGSPWNISEGYVYPDSSLEAFLEQPSSCFILGHTHYPMKRTIASKQILNPGSLGQPRNAGLPTYALMETRKNDFTVKNVRYDTAELINRIVFFGDENKYLRKILDR
jgi:putative phosphoesterase